MKICQTSLSDSDLIKSLGGPAKVAELLGYDKASGGVQRVQNWIARGIPSAVKLQRPDLFMRNLDLADGQVIGGDEREQGVAHG